MSVYRAARMYLVPESTLRDRTRGNVEMEPTIRFGTLFSSSEENKLVEHVTYMASIGYGYNKIVIQSLARDYALSIGKSMQSKSTLSNSLARSERKRWNPDFLNGCIPGSLGGMSESGWSNSQLFHDNVTTHFIKYASVAELTNKSYIRALSPENLTSSFRKTGIYPFNNNIIDDSQVAPSVIYRVCEDE
ncbi:hypothetical protein KUTeg_004450 [Tegillarca granosa]|uniref:Uncharacterized protein n=1 Tax=Tegillarca granosa TaxID=220873 RepID=A0ABQ9FQ23_TEGGR|nr:hypothetical protein KUTeg_004450 [Tegillarca granosa]